MARPWLALSLLKKVLEHQESEMRRNTFGKVSYFQPAIRAAARPRADAHGNGALYPVDRGRGNFGDPPREPLVC